MAGFLFATENSSVPIAISYCVGWKLFEQAPSLRIWLIRLVPGFTIPLAAIGIFELWRQHAPGDRWLYAGIAWLLFALPSFYLAMLLALLIEEHRGNPDVVFSHPLQRWFVMMWLIVKTISFGALGFGAFISALVDDHEYRSVPIQIGGVVLVIGQTGLILLSRYAKWKKIPGWEPEPSRS
jgi:hypothetical protein